MVALFGGADVSHCGPQFIHGEGLRESVPNLGVGTRSVTRRHEVTAKSLFMHMTTVLKGALWSFGEDIFSKRER